LIGTIRVPYVLVERLKDRFWRQQGLAGGFLLADQAKRSSAGQLNS